MAEGTDSDDLEGYLRTLLAKDSVAAPETSFLGAQSPLSTNIEDRRTTLNDDPSQDGRKVDKFVDHPKHGGWDTLNSDLHFADGGSVPDPAEDQPVMFDDLPDEQAAQPAAQKPVMFDDLPDTQQEDHSGKDFDSLPDEGPAPEGVGKSIGRKVLHDALPFAASLPVMGEGALHGAALGTAIWPGPGTVVGGLVGAAAGGFAANWAASATEDYLEGVLGIDDGAQREANAKAHPTADMVADIIPMAAGFKVGQLAGSVGSRLINAGGMGGIDAAQQLATTGKVDLSEVAEQAAMGGLFNEARSGTHKLMNPFGRAAPAAPNAGRPDLQGDQSAKDDVHVAPPPVGQQGIAPEAIRPTQRKVGDETGSADKYPKDDATPTENGPNVTSGDMDPTTQAAIDAMGQARPEQAPVPPPVDTGITEAAQQLRPPAAQAAIEGRPPEQASSALKLVPEDDGRNYQVHDANGTPVGGAEIAIEGNKAIVRSIHAIPPEDAPTQPGPNAMGPAAVRDLLRQFQALHPEVTSIGGTRVSGARKTDALTKPQVEVPLKAPDESTPAPGDVPASAEQATDPSHPSLPNVQVERVDLPAGYIARSDNAGTKVYLSKNVPETLDVNGHVFDPADPLKVHELFERRGIAVLQRAIEAGRHPPMSDDKIYAVAHEKVGTAAERAYLEEHVGTPDKPFTDADFAEYQRQMKGFSEGQKGGQPPADLYTFMDAHEGALRLHTPEDVTGSVPAREQPAAAKGLPEVKSPSGDPIADAMANFGKPGAEPLTATVKEPAGLKPVLKLIADHPSMSPAAKAELSAKLRTAAPELVKKAYEDLRPKVRAKVEPMKGEAVQTRGGKDDARKRNTVAAVEDAFNNHGPEDSTVPAGKEALGKLAQRLKKGIAHATEKNGGVDPLSPAVYADGDTKKTNAIGGGYQPAKKNAAYLWLKAAKRALDKDGNITAARAMKFAKEEQLLRSGNDAAVREARDTKRIEADVEKNKRSGDDAVAHAENAAADPHSVEDQAIERIDAQRRGDFDVPHEEGEEGRTPEPVATREDLQRLDERKGETLDLKSMSPEEIDALAEEMSKQVDTGGWKNGEQARLAAIADKTANLKALRLARATGQALKPEVLKRAQFAWSEGNRVNNARGARPTSRAKLDMGASAKIIAHLDKQYPDAGSWINRPPGQLMWRNPIVKNAKTALGYELRSPTTRKGAEEEYGTRHVAERLNLLDQAKAARHTWIMGEQKKLNKMGMTPDDDKRLYLARENRTVHLLPEKLQAMYHQVLEPMYNLADRLRENVKAIAPNLAGNDVDNYLKRIARNYMEREDARAGEIDPITGVRGISVSEPAGGKERAFQALTDTATGERTVISPAEGGYTKWRNGKGVLIKDPNFSFKAGDLYTRGKDQFTMGEARTPEIMQHATDDMGRKMDYHMSAFDSAQLSVREYGDLADNLQHLENLKADPEFNKLATLSKAKATEKGWKKINEETAPPQFKDWYMDAHLKEQMEQYGSPGIAGVPNALRTFAQGLTKTIYWTPTTHILNHAATWFLGRGADNFTPTGVKNLFTLGTKALASVATQDATYQRLQKAGLKLEFAPMMDSHMMEQTMDRVRGDMAKRPQKWATISKIFGTGVPELSDAIYHQSNKALWSASDVFTIMRALELEGKGMTTQKAIDETHKFIPSYRIPSRILGGGAGNAFVTKLVTEPTAIVFGRYHWAVMNGLAHVVRELTSGEGKKTLDGVGHLMALGMLAFFVKPALDKLAELVTGNKAAEVRPFGPLTMPSVLVKAARAQTDPQQAFRDVATLSPMAETAMNLYHNRDYTGKKIIEPGDVAKAAHGDIRSAGKVGVQAGVAAARGTIAPLNSALNAGTNPQGVPGMVRDQLLSIKNPSRASQKFTNTAAAKGNAASNSRERKPPNELEKAYDRFTK